MGAKVARGKWIRGKLKGRELRGPYNMKYNNTYGTRLVWNSFKSTFKEPSKRRDAVIEETTWAMSLLRLAKPGELMFKRFLQMS